MNLRDPRVDPQPGDVIRQQPSKLDITVTERSGDHVAWKSRRDANSWTLSGWVNMVAKGAQIVKRAAAKEGE
jgi:hypothetical protein